MKDINQLRHLVTVFPSTPEVQYLEAVSCHICEPCLSHLSTLKELGGICQIPADRPIISLKHPYSCCEENLDIVGGVFGQPSQV